MKFLITGMLGFMLLFCGAKVKLVDATSQQWMGGRYESGKGTDYILTLKARGGSGKLVIDQLWIGENFFKVNAVRNLSRRSDHDFARNDTVYVSAGLKFQPDENGKMIQVSGEKKKPPREYDGEALLSYKWKGKRKFFEIDEFRVLEKIIYP